MKKRNKKHNTHARLARVTQGIIFYHRLSMGWDDEGNLEFDCIFRHMVGGDAMSEQMKWAMVEKVIRIKRHYAVQVNIYCDDGNQQYIESVETIAVNETLMTAGAHIVHCKETALGAVNEKHIKDIEWIAVPVKTIDDTPTTEYWDRVQKWIENHLKRQARKVA